MYWGSDSNRRQSQRFLRHVPLFCETEDDEQKKKLRPETEEETCGNTLFQGHRPAHLVKPHVASTCARGSESKTEKWKPDMWTGTKKSTNKRLLELKSIYVRK